MGGAGRTDIWTVGLLIYESAPLTGVGYSDFPDPSTPERVRSSSVETIAPWRPAFRDPHNLAIGTLGELGTVGLIVLICFLAPLLIRPGWGPNGTSSRASLASLVVMAMFLDLFLRKEVWLFTGIACGLAWLARHAKERGLEPPRPPTTDGPWASEAEGDPSARWGGARGPRPGPRESTGAMAVSSPAGPPAEPAGPSRLAPGRGDLRPVGRPGNASRPGPSATAARSSRAEPASSAAISSAGSSPTAGPSSSSTTSRPAGPTGFRRG